MYKKKSIRVLQIIGIVCGGGVEAVIMNYYRNIDRSKVQFDFIVDGKEKTLLDDEIKSLGGKVHHVTPYKENIMKYMYDVYMVMKNNSYDIIHDNMNTMALFSLFPAWLARKRIRILHNHTTNAREDGFKYYMKRILRPVAPLFANKYMACSVFAGEWMYGKRRMEFGSVDVLNNAIDLRKFTFSPEKRKWLRKKLGIADDVVVIGHVGRLAKQKNHDFLLEIFAEFYKKHPEACLCMVGDGPLKETIEDRIHQLGLENNVKMLGLKNNVYDYYNIFDVFLLPSLYEGLSVVTIEAQANGLPACVSTAIPDEAVFNKSVVRVSLEKKAATWCKHLENLLNIKRDNNALMNAEKAGYSICLEAKKLEDLYFKTLSNK